MAESYLKTVSIKSLDLEKQIVSGEVYAPNEMDSHGEAMLAEDIELMAHAFIGKSDGVKKTIDVQHDNEVISAYPVESFIARKGDPDYSEGAWVLSVKIEDQEIWESVKSGELNGFSVEALVIKKNAIVTIETVIDNVGTTEESDGHTHLFFVELDENGRVVGGRTSETDGHSHEINKGTATEVSDGHSHRYFIS